MTKESIISKAFRIMPESFLDGIAVSWANEPWYLEKLRQEFKDAPRFDLPLVESPSQRLKVFYGEEDGYYVDDLQNNFLNLHFNTREMLGRADLIETNDGIGVYRLNGTLFFSQNAADLFLPKGVRVLPLEIKHKGLQASLVAFAGPLLGFSLHAYGFDDTRVFNDTVLLLHDTKNKSDRFLIQFRPNNLTHSSKIS